MAHQPDDDRFRHLPERLRPEEFVETVDAVQHPVRDEGAEERDRLLRQAGGI